MKKLILFSLILLGGILSANAWTYVTRCGIAVETVSPEYFNKGDGGNEDTDTEDEDEAKEFYEELDRIYCGD